MKKSESIIEISKALCDASKELKNVEQNSVNPFYNSKYADLPSTLDEVKPILSKYGLSVVQSAPMIIEKHSTVETLIMHTSGEWIETELTLPAYSKAKDRDSGQVIERYDSQTAGSSITYGRRYSISAALNISSEADDDGNSTVNKSGNSEHKKRLDFDEVKKELATMNNRNEMVEYYTLIKKDYTITEKMKPVIDKMFKEAAARISQDPEDYKFGETEELF